MLNNSSHVHFTPFKKGIIIALEQRRVSVKEKDEEKRPCKRWRATNKRQTPRFILFPLCVVYIYKGLQALYDVLQSLHINDDKPMPSDIKKNGFKNLFLRNFSQQSEPFMMKWQFKRQLIFETPALLVHETFRFRNIQNTADKTCGSFLRARTTNSLLAGIYSPPRGGISASKVMSLQKRNKQKKANARLQKKYLKETIEKLEIPLFFCFSKNGPFNIS